MSDTLVSDGNPHRAVFDDKQKMVTCAAPACRYCFIYPGPRAEGKLTREIAQRWTRIFHANHGMQYEPGRAPDIAVDWEISASCSICDDGGEIEMNDGETIQCQTCKTIWTINGENGERDDQ